LTERLSDFIAQHREEFEDALEAHLPVSALAGAERFNDALRDALFPGGKRLRPVLALAASQLAGATREQGIIVGCAVEFLHSSSLILDDLPGMDDADLRRNRRALHLVYGEGIAVLAAVALLNQSYALLTRAAQMSGQAGTTEALLREAARTVGADGMIGGQVIDLEMGAMHADDRVLASRDLKTVALMRLMMVAGARARGADAGTIATLGQFGERFGRIYQICDDLLDELGESALSGKPEARMRGIYAPQPSRFWARRRRKIWPSRSSARARRCSLKNSERVVARWGCWLTPPNSCCAKWRWRARSNSPSHELFLLPDHSHPGLARRRFVERARMAATSAP
jgi:geranylgeranyl diphosphate synthase type II